MISRSQVSHHRGTFYTIAFAEDIHKPLQVGNFNEPTTLQDLKSSSSSGSSFNIVVTDEVEYLTTRVFSPVTKALRTFACKFYLDVCFRYLRAAILLLHTLQASWFVPRRVQPAA